LEKKTGFTTNTGEKYIHGFEVGHTPDTLTNPYLLNGQYSKFEALLQPSSEWNNNGGEEKIGNFRLLADGKEVYNSGDISSDITQPIKISVNLTGVLQLQFEATEHLFGVLVAKVIR
jgi:hypothetical protein